MRFTFLFLLLFFSTLLSAQNKAYYVDSISGKDANNGSLTKPWKSVSPVNRFNFELGDTLFFRGGQSFGKVELQKNDGGLTVSSYSGVATLRGLLAYNVGDIHINKLNFKGIGTTNNNSDGIEFYMDGGASNNFNNITIQNVSVTNFGANGISIGAWTTSYGYHNVKILNSSLYGNGVDGFASYGYHDQLNHSNLYIKNVKSYQNFGRMDITTTNTGSGFVVGGFNGGLIEYCEAYENGKNNRGSGGGPQGFWCYNSSNIIFQYSVSHDNRAGRIYDGGGFDIDGGSQNCIIQYCYSYNNDGPGYAFFEYGSSNRFANNTIRYNISQNDARRNAHGAIMMWAKDTLHRINDCSIYNNTVYVTPSPTASTGYPVAIFNKGSNFRNINMFNNIYYTTKNVRILVGSNSSTVFSNNDYYNPDTTVNFKKGGVTTNPLLTNPGGGKEGYVLKAGSPMINAGKAHTVTRDFIGTLVPYNGLYDIGAYESKITPPVAKAGVDQTITLPANATLNGSATDPDGSIVKYSWTKVSGPSQYTLTTPSSATTTASNLTEGTYLFRLTVTDNDGATAFDDVQVTVQPAPPPAGSKFVKVNLYSGTYPYTNTEWNNWNVGAAAATNKVSAAFKYSNTTASMVTATLSATYSVTDNGSAYGGVVAPPQVLRHVSAGTATRTLTLKGLSTTKTYNLELYASRNNTGNTTLFTIGATTITIVTDKNLTTKASFTNLRPNATGQIIITLKNVNTYNYLNGFILTELNTPTTLLSNTKTTIPLKKQKVKFEVQAFPNPASSQFALQIESAANKVVTVYVRDVIGNLIEVHQNLAPRSLLYFGSSYAPGIYFAEVIQDDKKTILKLIKGQPE